MDTDGDGLISRAEYDQANEKMLAKMQAMPAERAESANQISEEILKTLLQALEKASDESGTENDALRQYALNLRSSIWPAVDLVA